MATPTGKKQEWLAWLERMRRYCASQERTAHEVLARLASLGCTGQQAQRIVSRLREEGYLNDRRYIESVIYGKLYLRGWGKLKISELLHEKGIPAAVIQAALGNIDAQEYLAVLRQQALKKLRALKGSAEQKKQKLAVYLIGKGFEAELVWAEVEQLVTDTSDPSHFAEIP
ncbi:MAG: RecX family transcriptional regulator [Chitinophagales bacterium]|nr:RecX family transcriptional regulator [Chitinophagales bacterium]MDW8427850.1 regulatory protein RecX [Chitinophagales bacterium]